MDYSTHKAARLLALLALSLPAYAAEVPLEPTPLVTGAAQAKKGSKAVAKKDNNARVRQYTLTPETIANSIALRLVVRKKLVIKVGPRFTRADVRCGDCLYLDGKPIPDGNFSLFGYEVDEAAREVSVKLLREDGDQPESKPDALVRFNVGDFKTNLFIRTPVGMIKLDLAMTKREDEATDFVAFLAPGVDEAEQVIQMRVESALAEQAKTLETTLERRFLEAFNGPHRCRTPNTHVREEAMLLKLVEVCHFPGFALLRFESENRLAADPFLLNQLVIEAGPRADDLVPAPPAARLLSTSTITFPTTMQGVIKLVDKENSLKAFRVGLSEIRRPGSPWDTGLNADPTSDPTKPPRALREISVAYEE